MTNTSLQKEVLRNIIALKNKGNNVIISHGGGPFIKKILNRVNIESEFIDGQRFTTSQAFEYIEMVLKGRVNSEIVNTLNVLGNKSVGLSGKDGQTVIAEKRMHKQVIEGKEKLVDLGQVGNVSRVNRHLIDTLLDNDYIPVIACIAADAEGNGYNINGDTFAGALAGALSAKQFIILTDVDGLFMDKNNPKSIIRTLNLSEIEELKKAGLIQGGMIPKIIACETALKQGAKSAIIINGTKPEQILSLSDNNIGTVINNTN